MHNPGWAGIEFSLAPGSEETFQVFQSWRSSDEELMVVGLDARQIDRLTENLASISSNERWRLHYEIIAANAETVNFNIYVYV